MTAHPGGLPFGEADIRKQARTMKRLGVERSEARVLIVGPVNPAGRLAGSLSAEQAAGIFDDEWNEDLA